MPPNKIKQLEDLIQSDPKDPDLPFMLGKALLDAGRPEDAAQRLETAAKMNPSLAAIWRYWGQAQRDAGRLDEARQIWSEGIKLSEETGDLQAGKEMKVFLRRIESPPGPA